ncbi:MAG: hypothetical protein JF616_12400 [Fibrobacteres bacterium]|jgi:hypothetical protein|nr:hypothetical protein [Fibrobacterota bacterium]
MRNQISLGRLIASLCILALAHSSRAASSGYIPRGYWAWTQNPDADYARYLRITGDSGYYCSLDGKSGFAFAIVKDSITTPMNGMNAIQYMPNSGAIVITGSEKGVAYYDRFEVFDSTAYWGECGEQDKARHPTGLRGNLQAQSARRNASARGIFPWRREGYSLSGRKSRPLPIGRIRPSP